MTKEYTVYIFFPHHSHYTEATDPLRLSYMGILWGSWVKPIFFLKKKKEETGLECRSSTDDDLKWGTLTKDLNLIKEMPYFFSWKI